MLEARAPAVARGRGWAQRTRSRALRHAVTWAGLLTSLLFAYLALRNVSYGEVWNGLRTSNYWWLVPGLLAVGLSVYLKALRWRFLFARETRPPTGPTVRALLVCYFLNSVLPARAGEPARVLVLKQRCGTSRAEAAATVLIERAYDVLTLLLLLFVAVPWLPHVTWLHAAAVLALVLAAGLGVAILAMSLFGARPIHLVLRPLSRLPFISAERLDGLGVDLARGAAALRRPKLVAGALVWTTLGWLAAALSTWFVMRGFHLELPIAAALLIVVATNIAQVLPSSPSALGVFEAATLVALRGYGITDSRVLSFALVLHALNIVPYLVTGPVLLRGSLAKAAGGDARTAVPAAASATSASV